MTRRFLLQSVFFCLFLALLFFGGTLFTHQTYFAGDLGYYWWPRKAFIARSLQAGAFPLWDASFRCGIPFFANPDNGVLDAGQLPFAGLPFASALPLFHVLSFFLLSFGGVLWARARGWPRASAFFFAVLAAFGGYALVRCQFLTQLSTLVWSLFAAVLAGSGMVWAASAALVLSVFAGHWQTLIIASAVLLPFAWTRSASREPLRAWLAAAGLAAAVSAVQLGPSWVCARASSWGNEGIALGQATVNALTASDYRGLLWGFFSGSGGAFGNEVWSKALLLGIVPAGLAVWGAVLSGKKVRWIGAGVAGASFLLSLGLSNPASAFLYEYLGFLSFIRYPSRWSFGVLFVLTVWACVGFSRLNARWRAVALAAVLLQLFWSWSGFLPTIDAGYFQARGHLTRFLQENLKGQRYFLAPKSERMLAGFGPGMKEQAEDLRDRLYVRTALAYGLPQAGGFGDPLTPRRFDDYLERIARAPSPSAAQPLLSRCAAAYVLSADDWNFPSYPREARLGWSVYRNPDALPRAYWMDGERYSQTQDPAALRTGTVPLDWTASEQKIRIQGRVPPGGRAVLSDVWDPGWKVWVNGDESEIEADGGVFRAVQVPEEFKAVFVYRPGEWIWGLWLTAFFGAGCAAAGLFRARRRITSV